MIESHSRFLSRWSALRGLAAREWPSLRVLVRYRWLLAGGVIGGGVTADLVRYRAAAQCG